MKNLLFLLVAVGMTLAASEPGVMPYSVELGPKLSDAIAMPQTSGWSAEEETLHWDGDPDRGFSINGTYSYGCACRFTESEPVAVKAILYYLTGNADAVFCYVAGQNNSAQPGTVLDTTRSSGLGGGVWKRANMPSQPLIPAYEDFWTCVIIRRHPAGESPMTLDLGPIVPFRGGYINLPEVGPDWFQLTDAPFWTDRNNNIRAVVERAGSGVEEIINPSEPTAWHRFWPSPVYSVGHLTYQAWQTGNARLDIYDVAGNLVRTIPDRVDKPGTRTLSWDCRSNAGRRVVAGTYLYRLAANGQTVTGKAVVLD